MSAVSQFAGLTKARIEALTDGVFAVAMTLLVFEIKVPGIAQNSGPRDLAHHLFALWPNFVSYAISFFVLGIYWVGHHGLYHYIRRTDRPFLWLNLLFLFFVTLIPFSAGLIGQDPGEPVAAAFYGANLIAVGMALYAVWAYATWRTRLVDADISSALVRGASRRILVAPMSFIAAIALGFIDTRASLLIYAVVALYYIAPTNLDRHWHDARRDKEPRS
ncbi:MAG: TMEM175 family protein [Candidatus Acidiferrales bacterium]